MADVTTYPDTSLFPGADVFPGTTGEDGGGSDPIDPDIPVEPPWPYEVVFGDPMDHHFETGCDRGIIYDADGIQTEYSLWSGFKSLSENTDMTIEPVYAEGIVAGMSVDLGEYSATITALYYPPLLEKKLGDITTTQGVTVTNQTPSAFHMSYRTLTGSGALGDLFGHKIHLVYNCFASISQRSYNTMSSNDQSLTEFTFDIKCDPEVVIGYAPTAHYIIDSRRVSNQKMVEIEKILYGSDGVAPRMPGLGEVFTILS